MLLLKKVVGKQNEWKGYLKMQNKRAKKIEKRQFLSMPTNCNTLEAIYSYDISVFDIYTEVSL